MKKIALNIAFILGTCVSLYAQNQKDTTTQSNSSKAKSIVGINFGFAQLNKNIASGGFEILSGVQFRKHFYAFNVDYFSGNYLEPKLPVKNTCLNYVNFGYTHGYTLFEQGKNRLQLTASVSYAEFGLQDNSSSFFHSGNMFNIDRFITLSPGLNFTHKALNFNVKYRYSMATKSTNVYGNNMLNGFSATIGFRFIDKK